VVIIDSLQFITQRYTKDVRRNSEKKRKAKIWEKIVLLPQILRILAFGGGWVGVF